MGRLTVPALRICLAVGLLGLLFVRAAFKDVDVIIAAIAAAALLAFARGAVLAPGGAVAPGVVLMRTLLARRKMPAGVLADLIGITRANLAVPKNGGANAIRAAFLLVRGKAASILEAEMTGVPGQGGVGVRS